MTRDCVLGEGFCPVFFVALWLAPSGIKTGGRLPGTTLCAARQPQFQLRDLHRYGEQMMLCNHDHLFCAGCIGKWLKNNRTCPVDRELLSTGG